MTWTEALNTPQFLKGIIFLTFLAITLIAMLWKYIRYSHIKRVTNRQRKFGSALSYYHVKVLHKGQKLDLMFTDDDLADMAYRAMLNPEDIRKSEELTPEEIEELKQRFDLN